jgi:hypothetical protein
MSRFACMAIGRRRRGVLPRDAAAVGVRLLAGACLVAGCSGGRTSQFGAGRDAPAAEGTLEVHIAGAPNNLQLFVDGEKLRAAAFAAGAPVVVAVAPGKHSVLARFQVGSFDRQDLWSEIVTVAPVAIASGQRTRLVADVRGTRTDPAEERVYYFRVHEPWVAASETVGPTTRSVPNTDLGGQVEPGMRVDRGAMSRPAGGDEPHLPLVAPPEGGALVPATISIHGEGARPEIEGSTLVVMLVASEPAGAVAVMDGIYLGRTPLRVRLDPRQDHVLEVEREGCGRTVQLLSSADWKAGRTPNVTLTIECH